MRTIATSSMRRTGVILLVITCLSISTLAVDRIVSLAGLYSTIGDALLVSSDGDRILIEPGNYFEDLVISKSITLLPNQEGIRPLISGSIHLLNADGKHVVINGIRQAGHIASSGTYTQATRVDLLNSTIGGIIDLVDPYIHLLMMRDTLACQVLLSSGTIIGNEIPGCVGGAAGVLFEGASALPDDIRVIGNSIGANGPGLGVSILSDLRFFIENNYIRCATGYPAITVQRTSLIYNGISRITNNTIHRATSGSGTAVSATNPGSNGFVARNNAIIGYTGGMGFGGSHFSNVSTMVASIDPATGGLPVGSPLIDAGDPDPRYLDLDLTTNDVGCYGGSNSRANFTAPMSSAVVGYMRAPRVVAQGEAVNISAIGFDR